MPALEMPALLFEVLAPLIIDHASDSIGEMTAFRRRIVSRWDAHGLDLDHPAGT